MLGLGLNMMLLRIAAIAICLVLALVVQVTHATQPAGKGKPPKPAATNYLLAGLGGGRLTTVNGELLLAR